MPSHSMAMRQSRVLLLTLSPTVRRAIAIKLFACLLAGFLIQSLAAIVIDLRSPLAPSARWSLRTYTVTWNREREADPVIALVEVEGDGDSELDRLGQAPTKLFTALLPRGQSASMLHADGYLLVFHVQARGLSVRSADTVWISESGSRLSIGSWGRTQRYLAGWPWRSLHATIGPDGAAHGGTVALRRLAHPRQTHFRHPLCAQPVQPLVPLTPRPAQTLANTLVFAIPCMAIAFAIPAIRSHRRRKRNACHACGYQRQGLPNPTTPCPECGVPPRPQRT